MTKPVASARTQARKSSLGGYVNNAEHQGYELVIDHPTAGPSTISARIESFCRFFIRPVLTIAIFVGGIAVKIYPARVPKSKTLQRVIDATDWAAAVFPAVRGTTIYRVELPYCEAELIRGAGVEPSGVAVLHFHGGGLMAGGVHSHRRMLSRLSRYSQATVLSVGYRLLIGHEYSDAITDGVEGYCWLLAQGYAASSIVVSGDSGGGGLAVSVIAELHKLGLDGPGAAFLISPWVDFDPTTKIAHPNAKADPLIPIDGWPVGGGVIAAENLFASSVAEAAAMSPLRQNLDIMPPTQIHVGGTEILVADAEAMGHALARSGVPVFVKVWDGQIHLFPILADFVPEGKRCLDEIGQFIQATVGTGSRTTN